MQVLLPAPILAWTTRTRSLAPDQITDLNPLPTPGLALSTHLRFQVLANSSLSFNIKPLTPAKAQDTNNEPHCLVLPTHHLETWWVGVRARVCDAKTGHLLYHFQFHHKQCL